MYALRVEGWESSQRRLRPQNILEGSLDSWNLIWAWRRRALMDVKVEVCTEEAQEAVDLSREAGRNRRERKARCQADLCL